MENRKKKKKKKNIAQILIYDVLNKTKTKLKNYPQKSTFHTNGDGKICKLHCLNLKFEFYEMIKVIIINEESHPRLTQ